MAGELDDKELLESFRAKRNIINVSDSEEDEGEVVQSAKEIPKLKDVIEALNTVRQYIQQLGKGDNISLFEVENALQLDISENKEQSSIRDFFT